MENVWHRRVRSKVYVYLVPLIFIFYFVPAIQFVFQLKNQEESTGSLNICYHNFKCAKPLAIFSAFNNTISNISYMLLGLGFILCVYIKTIVIHLNTLETRLIKSFLVDTIEIDWHLTGFKKKRSLV